MADKSKNEENQTKCQKISRFIWNAEKSEFLGRTGISWLKITIFYIIFYACLAAFWIIMLVVFYQTLPSDRPKWILDGSRIGASPGLGFRPPVPEENRAVSTLIWYNATEKSTMDYWINSLKSYMDTYSNFSMGSHVKQCSHGEHPNKEFVCYIPVMQGKEEVCSYENKYGFPQGNPCILIKLNKIYGWVPENYDEPPKDLIKRLGENVYEKGYVYITCDGENPSDRDNMGKLTYHPTQGMNFSGYPFEGQSIYFPPYVFVRFEGITRHVLVNIECRAWAKNIIYEKSDRLGSVHFELMVD